MTLPDPRQAQCFRFVRRGYVDGVVELVYAFDDGPELIETITFPDAPVLAPERAAAFAAALDLLHFIAGVSYYKAGVPASIVVETRRPDATLAAFLDELYLHGLGEFAWQNGLDLDGRIRFPIAESAAAPAPALGLPRRTLVPIGGGKDSLVSIEALRAAGEPPTTVWVGNSPLIEACAAR
ncbi:MAG TPA: endonuclease domain-containing protein, partial [Dokdonella sp.]|nr:endonuclease domain-containing protein [Dokdonella sp.]